MEKYLELKMMSQVAQVIYANSVCMAVRLYTTLQRQHPFSKGY